MGKSQYIIQFGGLSMGDHQFEFDIRDKFFEQFSESEIKHANIAVTANLIKQNTLMHILFSFKGTVQLSCDRCLIEYDCPISGEEKLIVKHGNVEESTDELLVLREGLEEIDISQYLYEYIELSLPYKKVGCEDENIEVGKIVCDQETLARFNEIKREDEPNQEWDALKNINFNNN